jgi:hypothetical protein
MEHNKNRIFQFLLSIQTLCKQNYSAPWKLDENARKSTTNAGQLRPLTALISSLLAVYFRDLFQAQSIEHI